MGPVRYTLERCKIFLFNLCNSRFKDATIFLKGNGLCRRFVLENKDKESSNISVSAADAQALWNKDRREFELWALGLLGAKPVVRSNIVYGLLGFVESGNKKQKIVVQSQGDKNVTPHMIQDLLETVEKEGAAIGLLITLHKPRLAIITDSVHAGSYDSDLWKKKFLKIQIRTVEELLEGKSFDIPQTYSLSKKVPRVKKQGETQRLL
jgi:site-specific DNA-methyltransferase (adenine-specific)